MEMLWEVEDNKDGCGVGLDDVGHHYLLGWEQLKVVGSQEMHIS